MPISRSRNIARAIGRSVRVGTITSTGTVSGGGSSVTLYTNVNQLPLDHSAGDMAFVDSSDRLYVSNGNGWYSVSIVNATPAFTTSPNGLYYMDSNGGTATTLNLAASDSDGTPLFWTFTTTDSAYDLATITNDSNGTFTITSKTLADWLTAGYDSAGGSFYITFKVSDGISFANASSQFITPTFGTQISSFAVTTAVSVYYNFGSFTVTDTGSGTTSINMGVGLGSVQFNANTYAGSDPAGGLYYCEFLAGAAYHAVSLWSTSVGLNSKPHPYSTSSGVTGIYGAYSSSASDRISMLLDQPNAKLHFWNNGVYDTSNSGTIASGDYRVVLGKGSSGAGAGPSTLVADNASGSASSQWTYDPVALYNNIP